MTDQLLKLDGISILFRNEGYCSCIFWKIANFLWVSQHAGFILGKKNGKGEGNSVISMCFGCGFVFCFFLNI